MWGIDILLGFWNPIVLTSSLLNIQSIVPKNWEWETCASQLPSIFHISVNFNWPPFYLMKFKLLASKMSQQEVLSVRVAQLTIFDGTISTSTNLNPPCYLVSNILVNVITSRLIPIQSNMYSAFSNSLWYMYNILYHLPDNIL